MKVLFEEEELVWKDDEKNDEKNTEKIPRRLLKGRMKTKTICHCGQVFSRLSRSGKDCGCKNKS